MVLLEAREVGDMLVSIVEGRCKKLYVASSFLDRSDHGGGDVADDARQWGGDGRYRPAHPSRFFAYVRQNPLLVD